MKFRRNLDLSSIWCEGDSDSESTFKKKQNQKTQQSPHQQLLSFFNQKRIIFLGTLLKHQKGEEVDIVS